MYSKYVFTSVETSSPHLVDHRECFLGRVDTDHVLEVLGDPAAPALLASRGEPSLVIAVRPSHGLFRFLPRFNTRCHSRTALLVLLQRVASIQNKECCSNFSLCYIISSHLSFLPRRPAGLRLARLSATHISFSSTAGFF